MIETILVAAVVAFVIAANWEVTWETGPFSGVFEAMKKEER